MSFDVSDAYRLAADFTTAGPKAALLASRIIAKTALQIEGTAKENAPVDTGALRNSIGSDIEALRAVIGPTVDYGPHVEFGTSRMAPQPYMGPAVDRHSPGFYAAMEAAAGQALG